MLKLHVVEGEKPMSSREDFAIKGVLREKYTNKINSDKTKSWIMTRTTMQAREAGENYKEKATGVLLLFGCEQRWCRPGRDRAIKHDSTDAGINGGRKLSSLHPF